MIYVACGLIMMVIGILWLISPAKRPNRIYGYLSYLAQVNKESFKFAQRRASLYYILFGLIQVVIGLIIHFLNWDRYFLIWLLTFYLFILLPIVYTQKSLKILKRYAIILFRDILFLAPDKTGARDHKEVKA